jgi:Histidine kinase/Histidine kinase-, DNA gyrase B-, and HSP90-like ATPase
VAQEQHTSQIFPGSWASKSGDKHSADRRRLLQSKSKSLAATSTLLRATPRINSELENSAASGLILKSSLILKSALLMVTCCTLLSGCRSRQVNAEPYIEFSKVPMVNEGGTRKRDPIEGHVVGALPGQRIVLFARSGAWYVQPFADQPFTEIQSDSKWANSTHLGTEYAALLVEPDYDPPPSTYLLPSEAGVVAVAIVKGEPRYWQTWWFRLSCGLIGVFALLAYYRFRLRQLTRQLNVRFEERLAERTRIAQDLHDTLLQGFLSASMQLHVAADQLPTDSPAKPLLSHVQQLMAQVIEEGRNAVRGLRSSESSGSLNLEQAFSRIQQELAVQEPINFRVIVEGRPRLLHPIIRDEVYRIGREALVNAFRHSQAKSIEVEVEYSAKHLRILVSDDGRGIDSQVLRSGRDGHWGLSGMRERADRIGARLKVRSRAAAGAEVELSVPGNVAFKIQPSRRLSGWFARLYPRKAQERALQRPEREED